MNNQFLNRCMTEAEQRLYEEGRCICCGQKLKSSDVHTEKVECKECYVARVRTNADGSRLQRQHDVGDVRSSAVVEYKRRMGYGVKDSS